jgi:hypothetical protein
MSDKIICRINDTPKIIVKFGEQGLMGPMGPSDHALLSSLSYDTSGHTGFQRLLIYIPEYKCYEVE